MREEKRWRVRSATLRWLILIFLLMEFIDVTTAAGSHRAERWQRFKRQHNRPSGDARNNHNNHRNDQRHPSADQENVIPHNVALGDDSPSSSSHHGAAGGRWSVWSESSPCSRTCGGGVASKTRTCHDFSSDGVPLCLGPNKKFLSCNVQDCPEGSVDFRAEQCARFNNVPFDGRYYDWIPFTKAPNKCELNCMPKGENVYYRHARRVVDGTTCHPDTLDVCVEGNCLPVGCDKILGSKAKEDKCRVCGGDGSTCKTLDGVYVLSNLQTGYNDILVIPVGATNVVVQQRQPSNNYLAIRNLTNHYYLNGNWRIDFPRDLRFAGTTFHYERRPHSFSAPESIKALGPTKEVLYIVLLYQEPNNGVHYEYSIPSAASLTKHDTYNWIYGSYGECSLPCAGGFQIRNVSCAKQSNFENVPDYLCDPQLKPQVNRSCNTQPCNASWHVGEWQACSAVCGKGVHYRTVYCYQLSSGDVPIVVDDSKCQSEDSSEGGAGPKPDQLKSCASKLECPSWSEGPWGPCDAICGPGEHTRTVTCQRNNSGSLELFPDKICLEDHPEKPDSKKKCDAGPCEGLDWIHSEWSGCDSCGQKYQSRQSLCSTQSGTVYPDDTCHANRLRQPIIVQECNDSLPCDYMWYATQWSDCSSKCGNGIQSRTVFCGTSDNITVQQVEDDLCILELKYNDTQDCVGTDCEARWFTGPWNRCTAPCGGGHRTRTVLCLHNSKVVNGSACDASEKLLYREPCNTHPCDEDEILTVGGCKDSKHGCCPDGVTPAGANYEGCPVVQTTASCEESEFGCCKDGVTHALGPFSKGCPKVYRCKDSKFKCCPDGVTPAKGPSGEGCPEPENCASTKFGCCPDGVTPAEGLKLKGCDVVITHKCLSSEYGCCPDGATDAEGSGFEGCDAIDVEPIIKDGEELGSGIDCQSSTHGCCQDNITAALGPNWQGCEEVNVTENATISIPEESLFDVDCENTTYGCCPDNITVATGPDNEGCEIIPDCVYTEHGCCPDNKTAASGLDNEGCDVETVTEATLEPTTLEVTTPEPDDKDGRDLGESECVNTAFGCCLDGVTEATGPHYEGCPSTEPACRSSPYGCCHDGQTTAQGPNLEGCQSCTETTHGCCYDHKTPAKGPQLEGCGCETYPYGCCPDGVTFATGENYGGCGCTSSTYGCCDDGVTEARGPNQEGCGCAQTVYGCCQDGRTAAQGPNYEGCPCETFVHGCCPDGRTPAHGAQYAGCGCEAWYYGCCPDGRTAARGPGNEGCGCEASRFGCCSDGVTEAQGPNLEGCAPVKQKKAGDVCGLPKERGECRNFTVKWFFDMEYGGCSRFWYGGCDGNENRFDSQEECQQVCVAPEGIDACLLPKVVGPCDGSVISWFYDTKSGQCQQFYYSGCLGNNNRYPTQEQCEQTCQKPQAKDPCKQPLVEGPCRGSFPRWYYDNDAATCKEFIYGGCKGNDNNFETSKDCLQQCSTRAEKEICMLPRVKGSCTGRLKRWYFDVSVGTCMDFIYSGCNGNANRFATRDSCEERCKFGIVVSKEDVCKLKRAEGPCRDYQIKWYYDQDARQCGQFYYGGCEGNGNRFETEEECRGTCVEPPKHEVDVCKLPSQFGNCGNYQERWFFDNTVGQCRGFIYSGCNGNDNNFASSSDCEQRCSPKELEQPETPEEKPSVPDSGIAVVADDFLIEYCHLDVDTGPCEENQPKWYYDKADGVCKHFYYGGCQGNGNRFTSKQDCESKCSSSQDVCTLPVVHGPCSGSFRQWYFNKESSSCEEFRYGGCEGNGNRFDSVEDCESRCSAQPTAAVNVTITDICQLPSQPGPCLANTPSWYYDANYRQCLTFIYGGCEGNENRFESEEGCQRTCGQFKGRDVCTESVDPGPCIEKTHKWYFDWDEHRCKPFYYGGCDGNGNRFSSSPECEQVCYSTPRKEVTVPPITAPPEVTAEPSADICHLPGDPGPCNELQPHWYYHYSSSSCLPFNYGGCEGNLNRFTTHSQCMEACHPRQRPCPDPTECYTLQCPYGIEQYRDDKLCPHCRCADPCADHICPPGTRCIVQQDTDEEEIPRLHAVCQNGVRDGACPPVNGNNSANCHQECHSDADCQGENKCCFNGCSYSCIEALAATAPEVPTPSPPSEPDVHKPDRQIVTRPHIADSEPEIITSSGSLTTLPCVVSGEPRPSVEWRRSSGETLDLLADSSRYKRLLDGSLQILEIQPDDAGDYVCIATNPSGTAEKSVRLTIHDPVPAPARIIDGVKVVQAPINEPCMLHCNAQGWPRPSVTWWRESLMLPRSSERYHQYTNYTLLIRQITVQDLGPYECRAYNGIGDVAIWEVTVYLDGPPVLDTSDAKLKYFGPERSGSHTAPQPHPQLTHENHVHHSHHNNHHKNNNNNHQNDPHAVGPHTNGDHNNNNHHHDSHRHGVETNQLKNDVTSTTTSVWNEHEREHITSTTHEHPVETTATPYIPPPQENLTAIIHRNKTSFSPDSEIQIDCETSNSQRTLWYKDGNLVHSDERVLVFANGTLFIKKALPMDSGTYKCEAANYYSQASDSINITITDVGIPDDCVDTPFFANCGLIVKAKYCNNKWYRRFCCRSCALDGQLSPATMADNVKDNLVA